LSKYTFLENKFGGYRSVLLSNESSGANFHIAQQGATALNFMLPLDSGKLFDVLDGFASPEEFKVGGGARCWIMAPFSNRIPNGIYKFDGNIYQLEAIPPGDKVIHGFISQIPFEINNVEINNRFIEVRFLTKTIRPGIFKGYPFAIDISIKYKLQDSELHIQIAAENVGESKAPFATGWHPYFKTSENGIEHLVLSIDADSVILLDQDYIPLSGNLAYGNIEDFPPLDFRSSLTAHQRVLNGRAIDNYYGKIKGDGNGYFTSSIYDPDNGLKISLFQKGGVTLLYTGDSLAERQRRSIALEPLQFITNAFNREEFKKDITILPGQKSVFEFALSVFNNK